jgi:hypothetical protein
MSREHVFADWIAALFGREPDGLYELINADGTTRQFAQAIFQHKVRSVCASCNNGWMSDLESAVKPFLGPMVLNGRRTRLAVASQTQLATWAVKTALVLDRLHPNAAVVPKSEYPAFYAARKPLPTHFVVLARRTTYPDETGRQLLATAVKQTVSDLPVAQELASEIEASMPGWKAEGRNIYRVTFALGRVAFQVFGHSLPARIEIAHGHLPYVQRIWRPNESVTWPPPVPLDSAGGLQALHDVFSVSPS